jgi:hypothetical protein
MTQGAVGSRMPTVPVVHLARLVETGAWFAIEGAVAGALVMLMVRRRGLCIVLLACSASQAWLLRAPRSGA